MNVLGLLLVSALGVGPGKEKDVANHHQPLHSGDVVIRRFERKADDDTRRRAWDAYCRELDDLWQEYREAGSTPRAWQKYKESVAQAKRTYVIRDKYLVAFEQ